MKNQVFHLGTIIVSYSLGESWFDRKLQLSGCDDNSNCMA